MFYFVKIIKTKKPTNETKKNTSTMSARLQSLKMEVKSRTNKQLTFAFTEIELSSFIYCADKAFV